MLSSVWCCSADLDVSADVNDLNDLNDLKHLKALLKALLNA